MLSSTHTRQRAWPGLTTSNEYAIIFNFFFPLTKSKVSPSACNHTWWSRRCTCIYIYNHRSWLLLVRVIGIGSEFVVGFETAHGRGAAAVSHAIDGENKNHGRLKRKTPIRRKKSKIKIKTLKRFTTHAIETMPRTDARKFSVSYVAAVVVVQTSA